MFPYLSYCKSSCLYCPSVFCPKLRTECNNTQKKSKSGLIRSEEMTCQGEVGTGSGWSGAGFWPQQGFIHWHISQAVTYSQMTFFNVGQSQYFETATWVFPILG